MTTPRKRAEWTYLFGLEQWMANRKGNIHGSEFDKIWCFSMVMLTMIGYQGKSI